VGAHHGQHRLAAEVDAGEVDLLHAPPRLDAGVEDRVVVGWRDAGVVEGDVDRPVRRHGLLDQRPHLLGVGHVAAHVPAADLLGQRCPGLVGQVGDDDRRALLGEPAYRRGPDAADASGDDRDAVLQASRHLVSPPC
jgi:hypothetical protein